MFWESDVSLEDLIRSAAFKVISILMRVHIKCSASRNICPSTPSPLSERGARRCPPAPLPIGKGKELQQDLLLL